MASKKRTCRVPKKVAQRASAALETRRDEGIGLSGAQSVFVAQALSSNVPVTVDVPSAMADFFSSDWRYNPAKVEQAGLYGGEAGHQWAKRVSSAFAAIEPQGDSADDEVPVDELFEFTDDETDAIVAFLTGVSEVVPEATDALEAISEGAEKMLETELEPEEEPDASAPDEDAAEAAMVQAALAEVGSPDELTLTDFTADAMEARERMAQAALIRERSLAMAKMASTRMTLAAEAPAGSTPEGAAPPADVAPKAPDAEPHHAANQPRDYHGRFAKVGARVRSKDGNLGYVTGIDNGQLVVEDDAGNEHTVDPKSIEVVTAKSPARLPEPKPLIEDPKGRLESYAEWAKEQMGITAAGVAPATKTSPGQPSPLLLSVVDAIDPSAVVALLAIVPNEDGTGLRSFERKNGGWVEAPDYIRDITGLTPPSLVEMDRETAVAVIEQIDSYDKKKAGA